MSFALLKAMTNASVLNTLADVGVRFAGATEDVPGIFRNPSAVANLGNGMDDTRPSVAVASNAVPVDPADQVLLIDGVPYLIVADAPDGAGMKVLKLERTV